MKSSNQNLLRITLVSAYVLFVEMMLIRWIGTEIRIFAYVQNAVLVASFLGLGLGCRHSRNSAKLLRAAFSLGFIAFLVIDPIDVQFAESFTKGLSSFEDSVIWEELGSGTPNYLLFPLLTYSIALTIGLLIAVVNFFYPFGQWLGRWMDEHQNPISAYSANVFGSLAGIVFFHFCTLMVWGPWVWLLLTSLGCALYLGIARDFLWKRILIGFILLASILLAFRADHSGLIWSPYHKLEIKPFEVRLRKTGKIEECGHVVDVNNALFQLVLEMDPERMAKEPDKYPPENIKSSHYVFPYELVGERDSVLVVGAGTGNDVKAALNSGAKRIDAVEIDPEVLRLGKRLHPNRPYDDPRVKMHVGDARAFLNRKDLNPYDLIWLGLLDSHTTPSGYTNIRLDHFVYTEEAFSDIRRLLAPDGVVVLYFAAERKFIAERLVGLVRKTFGTLPLIFDVKVKDYCLGLGGLLLIGGDEEVLEKIERRAESQEDIASAMIRRDSFPESDVVLTTDDWPYLYLESPKIPKFHLLIGAICLLLGLVLRKRIFKKDEPLDLDMFLLGAGFMLLEVSGVTRAALLFGTTWNVNAYIVGAILVMILFANLVASRFVPKLGKWPFYGLVVTLFALIYSPPSFFLQFDFVPRVFLGTILLTLPVFFAGIIFVRLWCSADRKDLAFGSNLLGALVGGVASMLTMLVGFKALGLVTVLVYLLVFLVVLRRNSQ